MEGVLSKGGLKVRILLANKWRFFLGGASIGRKQALKPTGVQPRRSGHEAETVDWIKGVRQRGSPFGGEGGLTG